MDFIKMMEELQDYVFKYNLKILEIDLKEEPPIAFVRDISSYDDKDIKQLSWFADCWIDLDISPEEHLRAFTKLMERVKTLGWTFNSYYLDEYNNICVDFECQGVYTYDRVNQTWDF